MNQEDTTNYSEGKNDDVSKYDSAINVLVGVIIGIIISIIVVWISYATRTTIFYYVPKSTRGCYKNDYINSVDEALKMGYKKEDILKINSNGDLVFVRPLASGNCIPQDPEIIIEYPEKCIVIEDDKEVVYEKDGDYYVSDDRTITLGSGCFSSEYESYSSY